tara:strand:- start:10823 stop:11212 length:390 start_codon:yes stop_codon:yes gene_type:complete
MADLEKIQLNQIRLDACEQHCFEVEGLTVEAIQQGFGRKVRCRNCKGEMLLTEANQYVRGIVAAGGYPLEVWANWCEPGEEIQTRCPQCLGRTYVEPRPEDYFDCDLCESTGFVTVSTARTFLKEQDEC